MIVGAATKILRNKYLAMVREDFTDEENENEEIIDSNTIKK